MTMAHCQWEDDIMKAHIFVQLHIAGSLTRNDLKMVCIHELDHAWIQIVGATGAMGRLCLPYCNYALNCLNWQCSNVHHTANGPWAKKLEESYNILKRKNIPGHEDLKYCCSSSQNEAQGLLNYMEFLKVEFLDKHKLRSQVQRNQEELNWINSRITLLRNDLNINIKNIGQV